MAKTDEKAQTVKTPQEFAAEYKKLTQEYGWQVVAVPQWVARDDGTYSMKIQYTSGKTPKAES